MQIQLRSGAEFYLDGLLVECILADLRARNLASVAMVCRSLRLPAQAAAWAAVMCPKSRGSSRGPCVPPTAAVRSE